MSNKPLIDSLKVVLADSYALYLKTQNYHWNVEGPHFKAIHELLEDHYTDLAEAIDDIAEIIRALGAKAPGTWQAYEALTSIVGGDENADAKTMLDHLAKDHELILKSLFSGVKEAQKVEDEVVVGALAERMTIHRKNLWMLKSMLK